MQVLIWFIVVWSMTMATIHYFRKSGKNNKNNK